MELTVHFSHQNNHHNNNNNQTKFQPQHLSAPPNQRTPLLHFRLQWRLPLIPVMIVKCWLESASTPILKTATNLFSVTLEARVSLEWPTDSVPSDSIGTRCRPSKYVECEIFSDFCWFLNKALIITCDGFGHFRNISLHQIWSVQVSKIHFVFSEKCRNLRINSYAYSNTDNCRAHWACNLGKATATCCPEGTRYSPYRGCQRDPKCTDACPPSFHQEGPCDTRMIFNDRNKFEQYVNGLGWVEMPCAPGTQYDPNSCQCSLHDSFLPGKGKTFFFRVFSLTKLLFCQKK